MLNSKKIIFILPDVAYIAELLPTKKEHSFNVQSFRQINGEFMQDENIVDENVSKLISKLEPEEYHLVLPDFLFTDTIIEVNETAKSKIDKYVSEKLLPKLNLSPDTHQVQNFILTKHKDKAKIQLSAIENSMLGSIKEAAQDRGIEITGVSALSWSIKAMISLEPSLSIVQMGSNLYLAQHYIGVDQTVFFGTDEVEKIVESIKTHKGSLPNIQTLYLLTNPLVESELKEQLSDTLPLQQLTNYSGEDSEMPDYVKQLIETVMKTLDISDFPVPKFDITKGLPNTNTNSIPTSPELESDELDESDHQVDLSKSEKETMPAKDETNKKDEKLPEIPVTGEESTDDLPVPTIPTTAATPTPEKNEAANDDTKKADEATTEKPAEEEKPEVKSEPDAISETKIEPEPTADKKEESTDTKAEETVEPKMEEKVTELKDVPVSGEDEDKKEDDKDEDKTETKDTKEDTKESDMKTALSESKGPEKVEKIDKEDEELKKFAPDSETDTIDSEEIKPLNENNGNNVIKNSPGTSGMLKMVFITITVLFITVAIGVGIGLGFLSYSNRKADTVDTTPVVVTSPEPEAMTEPSPSPELAEVDKTTVSILVVNATTIAGKAGDFADVITDAGFEKVTAANAKGDYDQEVTYVLMKEEDKALISELETALDTTIEFSDAIAVEDAAGKYDAVVVLANPEL